jgi:hypothetical protein
VGAALALPGGSCYHQVGRWLSSKAGYGQMALVMACVSHCEYRSSGQPPDQHEPLVGIDREVVPQHIAYLARVDPVAELAGLEQVAGQHRRSGQALVVQLGPDRGERVLDIPAVADEDLYPRGARLALRQALGEHRDLALHVRLVTHRLHGRACGDRYRLVVTGDHQGSRSLARARPTCQPGRQVRSRALLAATRDTAEGAIWQRGWPRKGAAAWHGR